MKNFRIFTVAALAVVLAAAIANAHAQTYRVLYNFGSKAGDPTGPHGWGVIAQGRDGNLYSTADDHWTDGLGTAFRITPAGTLTVLYHFSGPDGQAPTSGLTLGSDGDYYGTTELGGLYSQGTIFKITAGGAVATLYSFTGGADGGQPVAPPIQGFDGNFYGTTCIGGGSAGNNGTVYKITPSGAFTALHSLGFTGKGSYGNYNAPLVQGTDGHFYGASSFGGTHDLGFVFRVSPSGNFTTLFNFDSTHGSFPNVIQGTDGNLYGATSWGGSAGPGPGGVVFKITPTGMLTVLHNFTCGYDGCDGGPLMQATDGNLYGVNNGGGGADWGVLYRITPAGNFSVLHNFDWNTGASPQASLLQHTNGVLYSTTAVGGINNGGDGTFYSFDVGLRPSVRFLPEARAVDHTVEFLGQGFIGTTGVSFNGVPARFSVYRDTYLTATVPLNATTGFVTVNTPRGTLKSNKPFQVRPHILSFSPASGPAGTTVIIKGTSFKQTTRVTFGGAKPASFTVNSNWRVTAIVPSGAKTGDISITTTGAPEYSATGFTVTP
jgi:uncharacterized repeat protein (TIGR03803 family)